MASLISSITYYTSSSSSSTQYPNWGNSILSLPSHFVFFPSSINHNLSYPIPHLHRSFFGFPLKSSGSILRSSLVPPPPPPGKDSQSLTGIAATFSRLRDTVQIFIAVLFWMSLFFWASVSNGKNTGSRNKRDRFRK